MWIGERPARDRVGGDRAQHLEDRVRVGTSSRRAPTGGPARRAASWALTFAAWTRADFVSGGMPAPLDGRDRRDRPGRGERGRRGERYRVGGLGGGERPRRPGVDLGVARQVAREGIPCRRRRRTASPTASPTATNPEAFVSLTPATRWVLQPGHFLAPIASGRWQLGQEKTVCSISPIESDLGDHRAAAVPPLATFVVLRVRRRGDVDGHGSFLDRAAARGKLLGATARRVSAFRRRSAVGRWSGRGSTFAAAVCGVETQSRQYGLRPSIVLGLMGDPTPLLDALDGAGFRLTDARRAVAGLIADRDGPFTAADILADAGTRRLGIGRATVFRAIDAFSELGVVERIDLPSGEHAYVGCEPAHHHHVVCERCGRTTEIDDRGVRDIVRAVERRTGFRIDSHRLELFGRCPACASA